jgi:GT2 family glycosyltransferase
MKVFAIIVTYNGRAWIEKCVNSLWASTLSPEILVIDNASTDNTVAYIQQHFPEVRLIHSGANLGFGKANNIGMKLALDEGADYVFLLNQDAWIERDTINALISVHRLNSEYGIISPLHVNGDNTALEYKFIEYIQPSECPGLVSDFIMDRLKLIYQTTFVNAAAWLISKSCLETVGGFDPLYPHYGEDVDYIQRAKYFGYKTGIVPGTKMWHDSKILSWPEITKNRKRMVTIYLSEVKSIGGSLRSNMLVFLKRRFDDLTSHLLFRRFKMLAYQSGLTWEVLRSLNKISKARKASKLKGAFLLNN